MTPLEQLIEIYARGPAADVSNDPEHQKLCGDRAGDSVFDGHRKKVEGIKTTLEKTAGIQESHQKQAKYALKYFAQLVGSAMNGGPGVDSPRICRELTRRSYFRGWTKKQQGYYEETCKQLSEGMDFFLSFTQRNVGGAGNPVNGQHNYLIRNAGFADPISNKENELARVIYAFLSQAFLRGFYYPTFLGDSTQVAAKLKDAGEKARVFIQLVQNEMFSSHYAGSPNYCFEEFQVAQSLKKRMILVFVDGDHPADLIRDHQVLPELDEWYQFVRGANCVTLASTRFADDASVRKNRDMLKLRLVDDVMKIRENLWNDVPSDMD